jgi:prepilin-type N-terminal cleavage/methylation domain-containing protein
MTLRGERGVTMIELLIALMLLTIALLGLAASFPYSMQGVVAGGYQTTATLLAQQSIDQARGELYERLCGMDTGGSFASVPGYAGFTRRIDVTPAPAACPGTPSGVTTTEVSVVVRFVGIAGMGAGTIWDTTLMTIRSQ